MIVISLSALPKPMPVDRDVVVDDQVEVACGSRLSRARVEARRRRARPRSRPPPGRSRRAARSVRMSAVGSRSRARRALGALVDLARRGPRPGGSRRPRRPSPARRRRGTPRARRACRSAAVGGVHVADVRVARQVDVGRQHGHLGAAAARRLGDGPAHPPAGAVADVAHRVDRLAGAAGAHQHAAARRACPAPGQAGLDRVGDVDRVGQAADADLAVGEQARAGLDDLDAARAQRREVARPWPGGATCACSWPGRSRTGPVEGEVHRAEQPVAEARRPSARSCWPTPARTSSRSCAAGELQVVVARAAPRRRRGRAPTGRPERAAKVAGPHEALGRRGSSRRSRRGRGAGGCA